MPWTQFQKLPFQSAAVYHRNIAPILFKFNSCKSVTSVSLISVLKLFPKLLPVWLPNLYQFKIYIGGIIVENIKSFETKA